MLKKSVWWHRVSGEVLRFLLVLEMFEFSDVDHKLYFQFEEAAKDVADEVTAPRPVGEETVEDIQILLSSDANCSNLRDMKVHKKL